MDVRLFRLCVFLVSFSALLTACTANGGSIYFVLQNEQQQKPSSLDPHLTAFDVAQLGDSFYLAAGNLYGGTASASGTPDWAPGGSAMVITPPVDGAMCNGVVAFQGAADTTPSLYASFMTSSGTEGLYKSSGSGADMFKSTQAITIDANTPDQQVQKIVVANGRLLVLTAVSNPDATAMSSAPYLYCVYASQDGATFSPLIDPSVKLTTQITDATFDGTTYYATAGNVLYTGTALPLAPFAGPTPPFTSTDVLQGVYPYGGNVYVSSEASGIYVLRAGAWSTIAAVSSGTEPSLLGISGPIQGPTLLLLVGSETNGYYALDVAAGTIARASENALKSLTLYTAAVSKMVIYGNLVFACTDNQGLWMGAVSTSASSGVDSWKIQ